MGLGEHGKEGGIQVKTKALPWVLERVWDFFFHSDNFKKNKSI